MAKVIVTGFKNDVDAKAFMSWFEGQGEQDFPEWLECRQEKAKSVDPVSYNTDMKLYNPSRKDDNGNFVLPLRQYSRE